MGLATEVRMGVGLARKVPVHKDPDMGDDRYANLVLVYRYPGMVPVVEAVTMGVQAVQAVLLAPGCLGPGWSPVWHPVAVAVTIGVQAVVLLGPGRAPGLGPCSAPCHAPGSGPGHAPGRGPGSAPGLASSWRYGVSIGGTGEGPGEASGSRYNPPRPWSSPSVSDSSGLPGDGLSNSSLLGLSPMFHGDRD